MLSKVIFTLITSLAIAGSASAKPVEPHYPEPVFVLRPENVSMDQFQQQFLTLCPKFYAGKPGVTDRPIFIFETFQERFEKDIWHGRKASVQCIYQFPTAEYQNIGVDVAMALGGDGIITIDPIETNPTPVED
ncbi:uncharacterized protein L201_005217 [Kwoniella dendrophila CBS 6074]|uniref:Uncharacterized protein n=1 Tax=Kwoniella dendrophila CBS 6074 TaxID=1295534 RepID=A0AAX4JYL6_9TREE